MNCEWNNYTLLEIYVYHILNNRISLTFKIVRLIIFIEGYIFFFVYDSIIFDILLILHICFYRFRYGWGKPERQQRAA